MYTMSNEYEFNRIIIQINFSWDLTDEEAQELGRRSIFHATHRDAASGGIIRVYHVSREQMPSTEILSVELSVLNCKYEFVRESVGEGDWLGQDFWGGYGYALGQVPGWKNSSQAYPNGYGIMAN